MNTIAKLVNKLIHLLSVHHIWVKNTLNKLEDKNLNAWKRNTLFLVRIYAKMVSYSNDKVNGNGRNNTEL